jgi:hypothetical protein
MKHGLSKDEEMKLDFEWGVFFAPFIEYADRMLVRKKSGGIPTFESKPGTKEGPKI